MTESTKTRSIHYRLSDRVKLWVTKALKNQTIPVVWDLAVISFPEPSSNGFIPALALYLEIPGNKSNTPVFTSVIIQPYNLTYDFIGKTINNSLDILNLEKAKDLLELEQKQDININ